MFEPFWQYLAAIPGIGLPLALAWMAYVLVLAAWIVWEKREPAATLSWLLALAALPVIGFLVYYVFGPRRIRRQRLRRLRARAALASGVPAELEDADDHLRKLAALAYRSTDLGPVHMLSARLLRDGEETYGAMLAAIAQARHHIHMGVYIFDPDHTGRAFHAALLARARAGVKVRLLLDAVGSARLRRSFFRELLEAGGELAWFHPVHLPLLRRPTLNQRSHRKMLIIDGALGFTGGLNISDTQDRRVRQDAHADLHLRFEGTAAQSLQLVFVEDWAYATGIALRDKALWPRPACGGAPALILPCGPDSPWEAFHRTCVQLIHDARRRVWLVTPYFVPSEAARMALCNAALAGLDVRVMVPQRSDSRLVSAAARSYYDQLLAAGVRIFEFLPAMLHAKAMLIDDRQVLIGSANFDYRSFRVNFELSAWVEDASLADAVDGAWADYAAQAVEITDALRGSVLRRWSDAAARLFSPLL